MKRIFGIGFYWGHTRNAVKISIGDCFHYEMKMYGISVKNTFLGVFVRGNSVEKSA